LLTYIVIGAAVLAALIALRDVRITLTNRRVARDLVPGVRELRKLASEVVSYRPLRSDESIPDEFIAFFDAAQQELTANGLVVLGDLMEVPLEDPSGPTRWFIDSTQTVCGWFGVLRNRAKGTLQPAMLFFSESSHDSYFITGRGSSGRSTAQPPSHHRDFFEWGVGLGETLRRHQAQITRSGAAVLRQPPTLEAGPALVRRLREHATRWRATQPPAELLEQDVRVVTGDKWDYVGPRLLALLADDVKG